MERLVNLLTHEYVLAMYGVIAWQLEGYFRSNKTLKQYHKHAWREMGRALVWVGIVVVFDDEILDKYNDWAESDYENPLPWMYSVAGFFVTILRQKIGKTIGLETENDVRTTSQSSR